MSFQTTLHWSMCSGRTVTLEWRPMRILLLSVLLTASAFAQRRSVFIITDAEGVAGVCRQDQTDPKDAEMRQLLTGEVNAAVQGFREGGADDVVVWDGHDGSQTL